MLANTVISGNALKMKFQINAKPNAILTKKYASITTAFLLIKI